MTMNDLGRLLRTAARVSRTRYPAFIFGLPLARTEIPVFIYHDVETAAFARDLEFLSSNGYRTLSLGEYLAARETKSRAEKRVLLTFDDARKSFWHVAMPLLRTFDARAVLFAPSYWMADPAERAPDDLFMTWEQLRACAESGLVDVQSHAHRHAIVPISDRVVDFANPQALARFDLYDWPMRTIDGAEELGMPAPGTPVYRSEPLLSASRRYVENGELTQLCRDFVARNGGEEFFNRPTWRAELQKFHTERSRSLPGHYLDDAAFERLVESEFELNREQFRKHLGYAPVCIAYPWMLGSQRSLELARRSGLRAAFGVAMDYRAERRNGRMPLPVFARLKCDWLQFLPGERRLSVFDAVSRKVSGFTKVQHLAH
jgi:peptidoglycan/xylan/chitin deacetylase (PgdA/CDA1 family)